MKASLIRWLKTSLILRNSSTTNSITPFQAWEISRIIKIALDLSPMRGKRTKSSGTKLPYLIILINLATSINKSNNLQGDRERSKPCRTTTIWLNCLSLIWMKTRSMWLTTNFSSKKKREGEGERRSKWGGWRSSKRNRNEKESRDNKSSSGRERGKEWRRTWMSNTLSNFQTWLQ